MMKNTISLMSEPKFGEDEDDYFQRQGEEAVGLFATTEELREACRLKYKQMEVSTLIEKLENNDDYAPHVTAAALHRAVSLLKEAFFL